MLSRFHHLLHRELSTVLFEPKPDDAQVFIDYSSAQHEDIGCCSGRMCINFD